MAVKTPALTLRVLEIRAFGPKREEMAEVWRKWNNEKFRNFYCSPNNYRVIRSRRIRWAGHVTGVLRYDIYIRNFRRIT
jgi:hypothetical protein